MKSPNALRIVTDRSGHLQFGKRRNEQKQEIVGYHGSDEVGFSSRKCLRGAVPLGTTCLSLR
jgi:hypothetical protein